MKSSGLNAGAIGDTDYGKEIVARSKENVYDELASRLQRFSRDELGSVDE